MLDKIKRWFLLKKAKKEEEKHIPSESELKEENKKFKQMENELNGYLK